MRAGTAAGLLLLLACACTPEQERPAPAGEALSSAAQAPSGAPAAQAPSAPTPLSQQTPHIALDGEGLRLVDPTSGSTRLLAFGTPAEEALTALTRIRGEPAGRSTNTECGEGPLEIVSWSDGFTVRLQENRLAGWSVSNDSSSRLTTMSGIGVGSTRRELEGPYAAEISQTTLGTELSAGGISGILASPAPDARIETLWAGAGCVFR